MPNEIAKPSKDDFHRERSRFLDFFAELEEALIRNIGTAKDKSLAGELKTLRAIRNDLVHSRLRFVQLDGQLHAIFVNVQNASECARPCRLVRFEDFAELVELIGKTKARIAA